MINAIANFIGKRVIGGIPVILDIDTFNVANFAAFSIPVDVLLRDSFNGTAGTSVTAHAPETGGAWTLHPAALFVGGTAVLSGNGTVRGTGAILDTVFLNATTPSGQNYEVSYKEKIYTTIASPAVYCGIVLDMNPTTTDGYYCMYFPGNWVVQKSGVAMTLVSGNIVANYADGEELDVRWQIDRRYIGNAGINDPTVFIKLWVNGIEIGEWKDSTSVLPSTKRTAIRFVRGATNTTGYHLSSISIQELATPEMVADTVRIDPSTIGKVVTIRSFSSAWDVHQPNFIVSGATKTAQNISSYSTATVTLNTGPSSGLVTITDPSTGSNVKLSIAPQNASWLSGWSNRKRLKVTGSTTGIGVQTNYLIPMKITRGTGVDTKNEIFIGTNARTDWGDIRVTDRSGITRLPYAILKNDGTSIDILIWTPILNYSDHSFFVYWGKAQGVNSVYKIASITDQHYDTGTSLDNRDQSLNFIDNFVVRMNTYLPNLAVSNGDKTGASSAVEATQLSWYQSVLDRFALLNGSIVRRDGVAPGNHDFEYMSFANILAKHSSETWMESGKLYGSWESTDYKFISLDSNYAPGGQSHMTLQHQGFGYINTDQITWLQSTLASSTKPVIVFCHHPLCEFDSEQFTLTKEIYHTQNREAVRKVLESSKKVIGVIHGHTHFDRVDVINGIPYVLTGNLTNAGGFGEQPATNTGNWTLFEVDKEAKVMRTKREAKIGVSTYVTVYESNIPFGTTIFDNDIGENPELTFSLNEAAMFEKASILRSPVQTYVNDDAFLYKFPVNKNTPDPFWSDRTIKFEGRTANPSFGRDYWHFAPQRGSFQVEFHFRSAALSTKYFKFGGDDALSLPGPYFAFTAAGEIRALNGVTSTIIHSYVINTWYKIRLVINVNTDTYSVYVDDVLRANNFAFNNVQPFIRQCEIVTETGVAFVDNLRLRKFIINEPSVATIG